MVLLQENTRVGFPKAAVLYIFVFQIGLGSHPRASGGISLSAQITFTKCTQSDLGPSGTKHFTWLQELRAAPGYRSALAIAVRVPEMLREA